jgi:hypothetical protein
MNAKHRTIRAGLSSGRRVAWPRLWAAMLGLFVLVMLYAPVADRRDKPGGSSEAMAQIPDTARQRLELVEESRRTNALLMELLEESRRTNRLLSEISEHLRYNVTKVAPVESDKKKADTAGK